MGPDYPQLSARKYSSNEVPRAKKNFATLLLKRQPNKERSLSLVVSASLWLHREQVHPRSDCYYASGIAFIVLYDSGA